MNRGKLLSITAILMMVVLVGCEKENQDTSKSLKDQFNVSYDAIAINRYQGTETDVVIPSQIDGGPVKRIAARAFKDLDRIESITIREGVTHIEASAFENMPRLIEVNLPDSVTHIGENAFRNNPNLTYINMPESLVSLGYGVFDGCDSLTTFTVPENLKDLGELNHSSGPHYMRDGITEFVVSSENPYYMASTDGVLFNKEGTTLIRYPQAKSRKDYTVSSQAIRLTGHTLVEKIEKQAFANNPYLETLTIPEGVIEIEPGAFMNAIALKQISIPKSVIIMEHAFDYNSSLEAIDVADNNPNYQSIDGVLYSKDGTTLIKFPQNKELDSFTVPNAVTKIEDEAFKGCQLESISLHDGIKTIGTGAFNGCSKIKTLTLPPHIKRIEAYTFISMAALESITLNEGLSEIGNSAFSRSSSLLELTIPSTVTDIDDSAFDFTMNLKAIHVSEDNEFYQSIDGVLFNQDETILQKYPEGKQASSYHIPSTVVEVRQLYHNPDLTTLVIPSSVKEITGFVGFPPTIIHFKSNEPPKLNLEITQIPVDFKIYVNDEAYETYVDGFSPWYKYRQYVRTRDGDHYDFSQDD